MFQKGLSKPTRKNLELLGELSFTQNFYLAGGTAVALYFGHRLSFDLDFFTTNSFDSEELTAILKQKGLIVEQIHKDTLLGKLNGEKVSFFYYQYPLLDKQTVWNNIQVASLADLAAMKVDAISSRGKKRDFIDLYIIQKKISLSKAIDYYENKYHTLANNILHILKSLSYFTDAEEDEMPQMIQMISWEEVKTFFEKEVQTLSKKLL